MVRSCILMNASANLTEEVYTQQYTDLTRQYEEKKAEYESLLERKKAMEATAIVFSGILFRLTELEEIPIDFDEALWNNLSQPYRSSLKSCSSPEVSFFTVIAGTIYK